MSYDDVEIEDMEWNEEIQAYTYPCPCGDLFQITKEDLRLGEEIANCPSCSLYITVIYNMEDFQNDTKKKNNEPQSSQAVAVAVAWGKSSNLILRFNVFCLDLIGYLKLCVKVRNFVWNSWVVDLICFSCLSLLVTGLVLWSWRTWSYLKQCWLRLFSFVCEK